MSGQIHVVPNGLSGRRRAGVVLGVVASVVLLLTAGCTKSSAGSGGSSAAASGAPSANAKAGSSCPDGAYKDPHGIYCVVVPQGYKPPASTRPEGDTFVDQFETDDGFNFSITYWSADVSGRTLEDLKDQFNEADGLTTLATAELPGGGLYQKHHSDTYKEDSMRSVIKAGDKVVECEAVYDEGKPLTPDDTCKTLRAV